MITKRKCAHQVVCTGVCCFLLVIGLMGHDRRHNKMQHGDPHVAGAVFHDEEPITRNKEVTKQKTVSVQKVVGPADPSCRTCHGRPTGFYNDIGGDGGPMVFCRDGEALIQSSHAECVGSEGYNGSGLNPAQTGADQPILGPRSCGYHSEAVVKIIAKRGSAVRLSDLMAGNCTSTNDKAVQALQSGKSWHNGAEWFAESPDWCFSVTGPPDRATGWPNMFQSWGSADCTHWLVDEMHSTGMFRPIGSSTWLTMLPPSSGVVCPSVSPLSGLRVEKALFDPVVANRERLARFGARTPAEKKYLSFEPWAAGFNNRRQSFELAAYMACLMNRTLIVPDLGLGPNGQHHHYDHHAGGRDTKLQFGEAYDLPHLNKYIPLVKYWDFVRAGGLKMLSLQDGYPSEHEEEAAAAINESSGQHKTGQSESEPRRPLEGTPWCDGRWSRNVDQQGCKQMHPLAKRSGYDTSPRTFDTISFDNTFFQRFHYTWDGSGPIKQPLNLQGPTVKRRLPLDHPSTNLHYPSGLLGTFYDRIRPAARGIPPRMQQCQRAMQEGMQFIPSIMDHTRAIVAELGGPGGFSAIHIRRGDFKEQFAQSVEDPLAVLKKVAPLFRKGETVLISTDDEDEVFRLFGDKSTWGWMNFELKRASDLASEQAMQKTLRVSAWGLAFQSVLVEARVLVANHYSTFSSYAVRQRYMRRMEGLTLYTNSTVDIGSDGAQGIRHPELPWWTYENISEIIQ